MEYIFVGKTIRAWRKLRKVTPELLAAHIGKTRNTVLSWETGQTVPDATDICRIAKFFHAHPEKLFARIKPKGGPHGSTSRPLASLAE